MSVLDNYECEGQMSMFDLYGRDFSYGRMYQGPSVLIREMTLDAYLKKFAELRIKMPQYLCLKKENGVQADASWDQESSEYIAWLGKFQTLSFGERPNAAVESCLSEILEDHPHQKYCLSAKACQGILRRAENRGKELPPLLKETLTRQSLSKNEQDVMGGAKESLYNATESEPCQQLTTNQFCNNNEETKQPIVLESNQNHATIKEDGKSPTLSASMGMGGGYVPMVVEGFDGYNTTPTGNVSKTITSGRNDTHNIPVVLEGNGQRDSHKDDGYKESETMYTLNTVEQHAVCYGVDAYNQTITGEKTMSITGAATDPHHIPCAVCYSQDAYDKYTENEKCASLKASGGVYGGGGAKQ